MTFAFDPHLSRESGIGPYFFSISASRRSLPPLNGRSGQADWHEAVHRRANPRGPHRELWYHAMGCESWIEVERDTQTHAILSARLPLSQEEEE